MHSLASQFRLRLNFYTIYYGQCQKCGKIFLVSKEFYLLTTWNNHVNIFKSQDINPNDGE